MSGEVIIALAAMLSGALGSAFGVSWALSGRLTRMEVKIDHLANDHESTKSTLEDFRRQFGEIDLRLDRLVERLTKQESRAERPPSPTAGRPL